jgi:hypothetical protein
MEPPLRIDWKVVMEHMIVSDFRFEISAVRISAQLSIKMNNLWNPETYFKSLCKFVSILIM